jgi:hypothetical protein
LVLPLHAPQKCLRCLTEGLADPLKAFQAVRFALTENPAADARPVKREDFFSLVQEREPREI